MKSEILQSMRKAWSTINKKRIVLCPDNGFLLVEILLATVLFVLLVTALVGAYLYGEESTMLAGNRSRAVFLAEEGLEAARNIRDTGFSNLANGVYGLTTTSNQWNLSDSSTNIGIFTRQVTISSIDATRKFVTSSVTWQQNPQRIGSVILTTYLTNWIATAGGGLSPASCLAYCATLPAGYSNGICRETSAKCVVNSEVYEAGGDSICVTNFPGNTSKDTCCCVP